MQQISALQSELVGLKAATNAQISSLHETIANLAQENELLKRRLFGNKTERSRTSEMQLVLGDLLKAEEQLQKQLDEAVEAASKGAGNDAPPRGSSDERAKPKGRRDLLASKLPRYEVEIRDAELEEQGHRLLGFDDSGQLMYRRGGFMVLVKRVARYEVTDKGAKTAVSVPTPTTLFPRGLLHTSTVAHLIVSKFGLGVPHYRLEQSIAEQGLTLDRGTMSRYMEQAGNTLGSTIVNAMWVDARTNGHVISTDATGALIQGATGGNDGRAKACKKGHFFTAVVDCDSVCTGSA